MKRNNSDRNGQFSKIALAVLAMLGVAKHAEAQDSNALIAADTLEGVTEVRQLADGSVELVFADGQVVKVDASDVTMQNGQVYITADALAALADNGAFAFLGDNALLIGAGVAATALGVGLGVGLNGAEITDGDDIITGSEAADIIDGLAGNDQIAGLGGDDTLSGSAGDDTIDGGLGNDTIIGGAGSDTLIGAAGDDVFITDAQDDINGGTGSDTADFSSLTTGINVDLDVASPQGPASQNGAVLDAPANAGGQQIQELDDIENVIGSQGDDVIFGNNEVNILDGQAGDDVFHSFGGADTINGGAGNDTLLFSAGPGVVVDLDDNGDATSSVGDTLTSIENLTGSAAGDDQLSGNAGVNILNGNGGNDILDGEGGADILIGGAGDDTIISDGLDTIDGGEGIDTVDFSAVAENTTGGAFNGVIVDLDINSAGPNGTPSQDGAVLTAPPAAGGEPIVDVDDVENVIGSDFNDGLFGNNEVNILSAGEGNDLVHGFAGDDFLAGGEGTDTVLFSAAPDDITVDLNAQVSQEDFDAAIEAGTLEDLDTATTGPAGENVLSGFENVTAGVGDDTLIGNEVDNVLNGNDGDDTLVGGLGNDTLIGGEGFDTADFSDIDVPVEIVVNAEGDGTATRETGFSVEVSNVVVDTDNLLENATLNPDLSGDFVTEALEGNLYFNIHTNDFNGGEIRGQLDTIVSDVTDPETGVRTIVLSAELDSAQEPGGTSDSEATGTGSITIVVDADGNITYSAELDVTGLATSDLLPVAGFSSIHLHNAPAGDDPDVNNGPVVLDIIQDAGGDIFGNALSEAADSGDGDVFDEAVEVDTLESIEAFILSDDNDSFISSGAGSQTVLAGEGDDFVQAGGGSDVTDGGEGNDTVSFADIGPAVTVSVDENGDGEAVYVVPSGTEIVDTLTSFENFVAREGGEDEINLSSFSEGVRVDLDINTPQPGPASQDGVVQTFDADGNPVDLFTLTDFENITGTNFDDVLLGNNETNIINGGAGNDSIHSFAGVDTIDGGEGIDTALFSAGAGVIVELDEDGSGQAFVNVDGEAGAESDLFFNFENVNGSNNVNSSNGGADILTGNSQDNVLNGQAGDDILNGQGGNDTLLGGAGNDTLLGGAGDDFVQGGGGSDTTDGGEGIDTVSFADIGANVVVNLEQETAAYEAPDGNPIVDTVVNFENVLGSDNNDSITGDANDNVLTGGLGNDTLIGGEGFDTADFSDIDVPITVEIDAEGNGTVTRETGFSVEVSNVVVDTDNLLENATLNPDLSGDFVTEALEGNLYFNIHTNDFNGGEIRGQLDTIVSDVIDSETGVRTIVLSAELDSAQEPGGTSDSEATGTGSITIVVDADGNITYSAELDVTGLATSDLLPVAGFSAIHLHNAPAGDDPDVNNGPVVLDIIQDAGGDIFGNALSSDANSGNGDANSGDGDVFDEAVEVDTLESIEQIIGSDDADTVNLSQFNGVTVDLDLSTPAPNPAGDGSEGPQDGAIIVDEEVAVRLIDFENVIGSDGNDVILGNNEINILEGGLGNDSIHSFGGVDTIDGGEGIDTALFSAGAGVIVELDEGGSGQAFVNVDGEAGAESDHFFNFENVNGSNNVNSPNGGDDILIGNSQDNVLNGQAGDDQLFGGGGADTLNGGDGDDFIQGGGGSDVTDGGEGNDTVSFADIGPAVTVSVDENGDGEAVYVVPSGTEIVDTLTSFENFVAREGGEDEINLSSFSEGVRVDLDINTPQPGPASQDGVVQTFDADGNPVDLFTLTDFENITGTDFDDVLLGNNETNIIDGGAGNDSIHSFGGADTIIGGEGIDTALFTAGPGVIVDLDDDGNAVANVNLDGKPGAVGDTLEGFENINGSASGDDILSGNDSVNVLFGNGGNDILNGEGGDDELEGGLGDDELDGGDGDDTALFADNSDDITVTDNGDGTFTVETLTEGTDTLTNIETIVTADGTISLVSKGPISNDTIAEDALLTLDLTVDTETNVNSQLDAAFDASALPADAVTLPVSGSEIATLDEDAFALDLGSNTPPVPLSGSDLGDSL